MNAEVHIVPLGLTSWAVRVGTVSYQSFESEEKALEFGRKMASKSKEDYKIVLHDREGNVVNSDDKTDTVH